MSSQNDEHAMLRDAAVQRAGLSASVSSGDFSLSLSLSLCPCMCS